MKIINLYAEDEKGKMYKVVLQEPFDDDDDEFEPLDIQVHFYNENGDGWKIEDEEWKGVEK